jgi:hypothetical protein
MAACLVLDDGSFNRNTPESYDRSTNHIMLKISFLFTASAILHRTGGARDERNNSSNMSSIPCPFPGSAFAYRIPDSYGQGIGPGPGLPGPQGGYLSICEQWR